MKSINRGEFYTPPASGFWSYKPIDAAYCNPNSMNNHPLNSINDTSPYVHVDRSLPEESSLYLNPVKSTSNPYYAATASKKSHYDDFPSRIAKPFPNPMNANQYKPPHQFYTSNCLSHSYSFAFNQSALSEKCAENIDQDDFNGKQNVYPTTNNDFKLQRPSTFQNTLQPKNSLPYFQMYASVPFYENESGQAKHVMVPCSFIQPSEYSFYDCASKHPNEVINDIEKSNDSPIEGQHTLYLDRSTISTNFERDQNSMVNDQPSIDKYNTTYENFNGIEYTDGDEFLNNRSSIAYANAKNNQYNDSSICDTPCYGNYPYQQDISNELLIQEEERLNVS